MFVPVSPREKPVLKRLDHLCGMSYTRELCAIDVKGNERLKE